MATLNGYKAFYNGKTVDILADSSYQAQLVAAKVFKVAEKKRHMISVKSDCAHPRIGDLEYDDDELAMALSENIDFWGSGICLECKTPVDFQILRGDVTPIVE